MRTPDEIAELAPTGVQGSNTVCILNERSHNRVTTPRGASSLAPLFPPPAYIVTKSTSRIPLQRDQKTFSAGPCSFS